MTVPIVRLGATCLALAAMFGVGACASTPEPQPTPTPVSSATTSPTPEAMVVRPGDKPPTVFDGDCDAAVPTSDLTELVGASLVLRSSESTGDTGNVGGLSCAWNGDGGMVTVEMLPLSGLNGVAFPADQQGYYFEDCDPSWVCSWAGETDELWIATSFQLSTDMTREAVDGWGSEIAEAVDVNFSASAPIEWERDRSGWWPVLDCGTVARQLEEALGDAWTGEPSGYPDPPRPGSVMAALASQRSSCLLTSSDPAVRQIELYASAGTAWTLPASPDDQEVDSGVPGIAAWEDSQFASVDAVGYALTDGVNAMQLYLPTGGPSSASELLTAFAGLAASGWE